MLTRRRFLSVVAATSVAGVAASFAPVRTNWTGRAMGAEVSISVGAAGRAAEVALDAARDTIQRMESLFSLYDPSSALSRLNREGKLVMPAEFARLVGIADRIHGLSGGLFDPTVQPLFTALATSAQLPSFNLIGWKKVEIEGRTIRLGKRGMALTFNGIAQGFATDRVSEVLKAHGFDRVLVNIGEYRVGSSPMSIGIADHDGKLLAQAELHDLAVATSSPLALRFGDKRAHILSPKGAQQSPYWKTVSVVAPHAAEADGFSTALALTADRGLARRLIRQKHVERVFLEGPDGEHRWV